MSDYVIGVLGGMGTYATIHLFQQYADVFQAEKEWERPRIIIDNRCTMPSRVRAFLYEENVQQLVDEMANSMANLVKAGCTRIILACNTSHLFLPKIYEQIPELESKVVHIIYNCVDEICKDDVKQVFLLGTEGTIDSGIYQNAFIEAGSAVECLAPKKEEYALLRECIEAVKQNKYTDHIKEIFLNLINRYDNCILGCTELPILYSMYQSEIQAKKVYDPLLMAVQKIKKEYDEKGISPIF